MRLNQIKLSGFKSFAEPTTFQLPGQRVGVVGPNGCGKSNIIDAVRWVLGESKASELRGESMQDVIFNGSGQRKPAGRASVELVFDNADGRAGGAWNRFGEIAVKRVLTRDGTSSYHLNNQPVRRRDVQDVFLGTGLGPRAYAIIGQGTISRIIESRPEELRLFLEEAAGVSKYKERRRDTEHRLADTRSNLTRVDDILRELNASLDKLQAQAAVAARYRALQDEATARQHQQWFLQHRDAAAEARSVERAAAEAATALEAGTAELRSAQADLEALRQAHFAAGDALHARQGELADAALAVSRLEDRIRYVHDARQRTQARLAALEEQDAGWAARRDAAQAEARAVAERIDEAGVQAAALADTARAEAAAVPAADDAVRSAASAAADQRAEVAAVQQRIQVLAAEARHLEDQMRQTGGRRERALAEQRTLAAPDPARLEQVQRQRDAADEALRAAQARLHALADAVPVLDEQRRLAQDVVNRESALLADVGARLQAQRAVQERVQTDGKLVPWLQRHGLDTVGALWTRLQVESGWEAAFEAVLRERLHALPMGRLDTVRAFAADAPPAKLAFHDAPEAPGLAAASARMPLLAERLQLHDAGLQALLSGWLSGVYTADSIDDALAARAGLADGESVVLRSGHAVSRHAVSFHAADSEQAGLMARAQEIENLGRRQRAQTLIHEEARSASVRSQAAYADAGQRLAAARRDAAAAQAAAHALQVDHLRLAQQHEAAARRHGQLSGELSELDAALQALHERRDAGVARFEELDGTLGAAQERHAVLDDAVAAARAAAAAARDRQRAAERVAQEAAFEARTLQARHAELGRVVDAALTQLADNRSAAAELQRELDGLDDAEAQGELQAALARRLRHEQSLAAARSQADDLSARLRRADERRLVAERALEPLRAAIGRLQLELQAAQLGGAQYRQHLEGAGVDAAGQAALAADIEAGGVKLAGLQAEIERLQRAVAALGAVNLAALDELGTARERKVFLDAQVADLADAIQTLEGAIHKIDLETRALLAATFEQVNEHFGRMFPLLFGGGTAGLAMTGGEILDAGVQVMAQPPGKKNSTIHLLSGGEKALTAIALVFAIFQLNPAPFCLLDEVDAPLDDANTERFRKLVTEMSAGTQFLFISHNKIAMEMAEQLIGVTMQEQGVSRIVAVDIEAAVSLVAA